MADAYIWPMRVQAICFDYGGTLDGPGSHWLPRFYQLYQDVGLALPWERIRSAFDFATRCGYVDPRVSAMDLQALVEFHVARQLEHLQLQDPARRERIVTAFVGASRAALAESAAVLTRLRHRVALGVISNFYGNLERVLRDAGIAPLLTVIIDSNRVGVSKPDPAIFALAVQRLACPARATLHVGDSFTKDIVAAHHAGLRTAWLTADDTDACPQPELVDVRVRRLWDLESVIE